MGRVMLRRSLTLRGQGGGIGGQQIQFVGPELLDKITQPAHSPGVQPVVPVSPFLTRSHQPGLLQQQQML